MCVPIFSIIAAPITRLTGKDVPFEWGPEQQEAQEKLITLITSSPVLVKPDPSWQFELEVDTSQIGTGAILYQRDLPTKQPDGTEKLGPRRPVRFHSQKFTTTEQNYPIYDQEFLAIICGLRHWLYLLKGTKIPVLVFTDHANLHYYHDPRKIGPHITGYLPEREQYRHLAYLGVIPHSGLANHLIWATHFAPLPTAYSCCIFQLRFLSKMTPRYFALSTGCTILNS